MNNLYILCGIPGSGKSTWIKMNGYEQHTVSRDKVRYSLLSENDDYFSKETEVFDTFVKEIVALMNVYQDVYVDATHLNKKSRAKIINAIERYKDLKEWNIVPIVFLVPFDVAAARNDAREGREKVPMSAMRNMASGFKLPSAAEGFEKYIIINQKGETEAIRYLEE